MLVTLCSNILKPWRNEKLQAWLLKLRKGDIPYLHNTLSKANWQQSVPLFTKTTIDIVVGVLAQAECSAKGLEFLLENVLLLQEHYMSLVSNHRSLDFVLNEKSKAIFDDALLSRIEKTVFEMDDLAEVARLTEIKEREDAQYRWIDKRTPVTADTYQLGVDMNAVIDKLIAWRGDKAFEVYADRTRFTQRLIRNLRCPIWFAKKWVYKYQKTNQQINHDLDEDILFSESDLLIPLKIRMINRFPNRHAGDAADNVVVKRQLKIIAIPREAPNAVHDSK